MADLATLKTRLATLEQAQIDLASGIRVARISDPDLGSIDYQNTPSGFNNLDLMIARTKAEIRLLDGTGGPSYQRFVS